MIKVVSATTTPIIKIPVVSIVVIRKVSVKKKRIECIPYWHSVVAVLTSHRRNVTKSSNREQVEGLPEKHSAKVEHDQHPRSRRDLMNRQ